MERRGRDRIPVQVDLTCRVPATPCRAVIHDVSYTGCRVEFADALVEVGATMSLELFVGLQMRGQIVWKSGRTVGVRFDRPVNQSAAVFLGLESPPEIEPVTAETVELVQRGFSHWFRRLARAFA